MAYLVLATYSALSALPPADLTAFDMAFAGKIDARLALHSDFIDARMRKRYAVPFDTTNPPAVVKQWLVALTDLWVQRARGVNPQDPAIEMMTAAYNEANEQMKEAADSKDGLFDLPLASNNTASGISQGSPLGYSETSPYVWSDLQACAGSDDDGRGRGS